MKRYGNMGNEEKMDRWKRERYMKISGDEWQDIKMICGDLDQGGQLNLVVTIE